MQGQKCFREKKKAEILFNKDSPWIMRREVLQKQVKHCKNFTLFFYSDEKRSLKGPVIEKKLPIFPLKKAGEFSIFIAKADQILIRRQTLRLCVKSIQPLSLFKVIFISAFSPPDLD